MKKLMMSVLMLLFLFPHPTFAYTTSGSISYSEIIYSSARDQYILNYYFNGSSNGIDVVFYSQSGNVFTRNWPSEAVNKTIFINCNGIYDFYLKLNETTVGSIEEILTTQIDDPICVATVPGEDEDGLNTTVTPGNDTNGAGFGDYRIDWDDHPDGQRYEMGKSDDGGNTWTVVSNVVGNGQSIVVDNRGLYRLTAYDITDEIVTRDIIGPTEFKNTTCNGCRTLSEMLSCPAWDLYMNEFSDMISGAIPPPPNLNDGMDYLIEKLAEQDVEPDVPTPPTAYDPGYPEQDIDIPEVIETDINPEPTDFQVETGGDGSGPVNITDPLSWVPDDTDLGYVAPDPEPDTPPTYDPPETESDTPPTYDPPDSVTDTIPNYNPSNPVTDTIPDYETGNGNGNDIPNYEYE